MERLPKQAPWWSQATARLGRSLDLARQERDGLLILLLAAAVLVFLPEWTADRRNRREARFWASLPEATLQWMDSVDRARGGNGQAIDPAPENWVGRKPWKPLQQQASDRSNAGKAQARDGHPPAAPDMRPPQDFAFRHAGEDRQAPEPASGRAGAEEGQQWVRRKADPSDPSTWKPYTGPPVDINQADEAAFDALPGIGASMARRAVRFRESLGGFYAVEQFAELWGLDPAVYAILEPHLRCSGTPRVLLLNRSPMDSLKAHPYIAPWVAERMVAYRRQHGAFLNLEEVQRVRGINDSVYAKLRPYLRLGSPAPAPGQAPGDPP